MSEQFFEQPILNSPYAYPARHWELDETGQTSQKVDDFRRHASFVVPAPNVVYDYVSRSHRQNEDGSTPPENDLLPPFRSHLPRWD